jgi:hypothetical protein
VGEEIMRRSQRLAAKFFDFERTGFDEEVPRKTLKNTPQAIHTPPHR